MDHPAPHRLKARYKALYAASLLALAALLCVCFGMVYTLRLDPGGDHARLMQLAYLCMVAGFFVLAAQALLVYKKVMACMGQDAARADEMAEQMERLAVLDSLTQAYNRGKFEEIAAQELGNVRRYALDLSGIMLDLDDFRSINQAHGYSTGDRLLANMAHFLNDKLRNNDFLFRWHGGKFIILCPHTDIDRAAIVAEKLRVLVGHKIFGGKIRVSLSLGVAQAGEDDTLESFLQRLQSGLTASKNGGRNQVTVVRAQLSPR
ncbi:putative diguanylate cyclase YdaM [Pseudodesulfovibrio hydrargyri]|uniref:diguanylate cyclase n=1 Tax=Pseudodesulfovibrio hydrargyri TaxID=2125990 RepID=A0A1J5MSK1_9BACT|nr:GGDEF domain-containing protein [Pseudodesulfovibrio hydrargyri]OIQ49598.1 putative diguanylate cyclase YdaM [Pseudodesulfovibrio hydrargyri]